MLVCTARREDHSVRSQFRSQEDELQSCLLKRVTRLSVSLRFYYETARVRLDTTATLLGALGVVFGVMASRGKSSFPSTRSSSQGTLHLWKTQISERTIDHPIYLDTMACLDNFVTNGDDTTNTRIHK